MATEDYLYLYTNVGINGFQPDADWLYQYTNIVAGAPCPFVTGTNLEIATQNQPLTIYGRGFQPSGLTTGPEARAHETADPGSPYVVMGALTAWTDTEVTVSVPPGIDNPSYIRVVHTGVDATTLCTGSNLVYQMVAPFSPIAADPEAGWWIEAWDIDNAAPLVRGIPALGAPWQRILNDIGDGSITVPAPDLDNPDSWNRHREVCDPPNDVTTLLKVYIDGRYAYAFWADQISDPYGEPGQTVVDIYGKGIEAATEWGRLFPHDYDSANPLAPTVFPDWNYGYSLTYFENFEEADTSVPNWEPRNGGLESAITPGEFIVTPDGVHSGLQRTYEVEEEATVKWRMEVLGSVNGMRVTAGLDIGNTDGVIVSTNTFVYNGEYLSELGNVPTAGTGCPGGSTSDSVWQTVEVEVTLPAGVTSITAFIQADHHASCGAPGNEPFTIRNVTLEAAGTNTPAGWSAFNATVFEVRDSIGQDFGKALALEGDTAANSTWTDVTVAVQPGVPTTLIAEVQTLYDWQIEAIDADNGIDILATSTLYSGGGQYQTGVLEWIPDAGRTEIILRIVFPLGQSLIAGHIDNVGVATGLQPATPGKISRQMLEAIQARGAMVNVEIDFNDTNDSDGNLWTNVLSINFGHGQTLYEALSQIVAQGFEWELQPRFYTIGGDTGLVLSVYNGRGRGPSYGIGDNQELTRPDTAATIRSGQVMSDAESTQILPPNATFGEGANDPTSGGTQVTQAVDDDAVAAYGRREDFFTNDQLLDAQTLQDAASTRLVNLRKQSTSATVELFQASPYVPGIDFGLGDTIKADIGTQVPEGWYRVARIGAELGGEGDLDLRYVVDLGTVIVPEDAVVPVTLSRLIALTQQVGSPGSGQSTGATSGVSGSPIVIPGQSVPAHGHPYPEIQPGGLSGDLGGQMPSPTVTGIRNKTVTTSTPAERELLSWDDQNKLYEISRRMNWLAGWVDQQTYYASDTVLDGAWTMIANKETTDRAAPQPVGLQQWLLEDDPAWTASQVSDVLTQGIRIHSLTTTYYAEAIRVWIPDLAASTVYQLVIQDNTTGALSIEAPFVGTDVPEVGWFLIGRPVIMGPGDDFDFLLISHSNIPAGGPVTAPWTWTGKTNASADPGTGNANARKSLAVIRINDVDDDSVDQSATLAAVLPGTVIRVEQQTDATKYIDFLVAAASDEGTWYAYSTTAAEVGSGGEPDDDALCDITFELPTASPMEKRVLTNQWLGNAQVDGAYAEGNAAVAYDDNAYGVDLFAVEYDKSPDWDIVSVGAGAGAFGGGGGGGGGHTIQDDGVGLPQQPNLNFVGDFNIVDDPSNSATVIELGDASLGARHSGVYLDADWSPPLASGWYKVPITTLDTTNDASVEDWRDGSGGLTAPVDGVYVVDGQIPLEGYADTDFPIHILSLDGIPPAAGARYIFWAARWAIPHGSGGTKYHPFSRTIYMAAGQTVQLNHNGNSFGAGNVRGEPDATRYNAGQLRLTLLSSDNPGALRSTSISIDNNQAYTGPGVEQILLDRHDAGENWLTNNAAKAPKAGPYLVTGHMLFDSVDTTAETFGIVAKNAGPAVPTNAQSIAWGVRETLHANDTDTYFTFSKVVWLDKDDEVQLWMQAPAGSARGDATYPFISCSLELTLLEAPTAVNPYVRVWRSAAWEFPNNNLQSMSWDNVESESHPDMWDISDPTRIHIQEPGFYDVKGGWGFQENMGNSPTRIVFRRNTTQKSYDEVSVGGGHWMTQVSGTSFWCDAGDTIDMQCWQLDGGNRTLWTGSQFTWMAVAKMS